MRRSIDISDHRPHAYVDAIDGGVRRAGTTTSSLRCRKTPDPNHGVDPELSL
jgi:hypothetical protein